MRVSKKLHKSLTLMAALLNLYPLLGHSIETESLKKKCHEFLYKRNGFLDRCMLHLLYELNISGALIDAGFAEKRKKLVEQLEQLTDLQLYALCTVASRVPLEENPKK